MDLQEYQRRQRRMRLIYAIAAWCLVLGGIAFLAIAVWWVIVVSLVVFG